MKFDNSLPLRERVCGFVFNLEGEVLLMDSRGPMSRVPIYEFPGGNIEENETPFAALQREILEEVATRIHPDFFAEMDNKTVSLYSDRYAGVGYYQMSAKQQKRVQSYSGTLTTDFVCLFVERDYHLYNTQKDGNRSVFKSFDDAMCLIKSQIMDYDNPNYLPILNGYVERLEVAHKIFVRNILPDVMDYLGQ